MTSSERHSRGDRGGDCTPPSLPAVRHSGFAKHWLAVDEGGAELTKAVFGAPARRVPPRPAPAETPMSRPAATSSPDVPAPNRFRATVLLVLLALALLFAQPAARLLGLAPQPGASGTAEVSPRGKGNSLKPGARSEAKRAGEA